MSKQCILLGAGGHAGVVLETLLRLAFEVEGYLDPGHKIGQVWKGITCLGDDDALARRPQAVLLANGIGTLPGSARRQDLHDRLVAEGYRFAVLVHPNASVASDVAVDQGVQVMAGAVVQPGTSIGASSIVNTSASVDHDCRIAEHVHIAPGATLSGGVTVGRGVHIGTGACVIQDISVGEGAVVGAGAIVTKAVPEGATVFPARSTTRTKSRS